MVKHVRVESLSDLEVQFRPGPSDDVVIVCGGSEEKTWQTPSSLQLSNTNPKSQALSRRHGHYFL